MHTFSRHSFAALNNHRTKGAALVAVIGLFVLSIFAVEANKVPTPTHINGYYSQHLKWDSCYENFECTDLLVPLDYSNLKTGTMKISVLKYAAQDPKHRIGSLVVNPGGPGASGVDYAYNAEYLFSPDVLDRYDIVGFDPRGVARSAPITCFTNAETDANYASDTKPDNQEELDKAVADSKDFVAQCEKKTKFLTYYSTANAARDMDILRAALGDEKLNYMGKSYGTYMGTLYAQLFPNKVGRMVLDGAVDPTIDDYQSILAQAVGFDGALDAFIEDCQKSSDCPLPDGLQPARDFFTNLYKSAATTPLPQRKPNKGDDRVATESILVMGTASALYDSVDGWPQLRQAITEAKDGYSDTFMKLLDQYTGRQPDGTFGDNEFDAGAVIDCLDNPTTRSPEQVMADSAVIAEQAPIFGPYVAFANLTCSFFPQAPDHVTVKNKISTRQPIIVIGTTRDPATPYKWAQSLHRILTNSQLLTYNGDGHTGQGRGNACIDGAIDAFYLRGTLPKANLSCTL